MSDTEKCPIGLDHNPDVCSAGTCDECREDRKAIERASAGNPVQVSAMDEAGNPVQVDANITYVDLNQPIPRELTEQDLAAMSRAAAKRERKLAQRRQWLDAGGARETSRTLGPK